MNIPYNIPDIFNSEDIIYHYCSTQTAIEHILYERKLRLSPRNKSSDPIESTEPWLNYSSYGYNDTKKASKEEVNQVRDFIKNKISNVRQVCFCMNNLVDSFERKPNFPAEYYGFLKPRMWDQYADNYNGVCLAFSLKELKKQKEIILNPIDYVNYSILEHNRQSIDLNLLHQIGFEDYCKYYFQKVEEKLFRKHLDYQGEHEYRIFSYSKNKYEYIDISNSLIGVIVSKNKTNNYSIERLNNYTTDYNIELLDIYWMEDGITIATKMENEKFQKMIDKELKKLND